jgi:hypothetical protein
MRSEPARYWGSQANQYAYRAAPEQSLARLPVAPPAQGAPPDQCGQPFPAAPSGTEPAAAPAPPATSG